jgi:hypothetical protein
LLDTWVFFSLLLFQAVQQWITLYMHVNLSHEDTHLSLYFGGFANLPSENWCSITMLGVEDFSCAWGPFIFIFLWIVYISFTILPLGWLIIFISLFRSFYILGRLAICLCYEL